MKLKKRPSVAKRIFSAGLSAVMLCLSPVSALARTTEEVQAEQEQLEQERLELKISWRPLEKTKLKSRSIRRPCRIR